MGRNVQDERISEKIHRILASPVGPGGCRQEYRLGQEKNPLLNSPLRAIYRLGARMVYGNPDQGEWIYERIRRPRTALAAAINVACFKLKIPRIWGPLTVLIEPVFGCNLKCKYCWGSWTVKKTKRPHLMSDEIFRRAIDNLPNTVETVTFSLIGEPLLHPNLGNMIEYVYRKGHRALLFTNGTLLTGERLSMVARSNLSVVTISIEPDSESARENRGIDLDQIRANVRELRRIKRQDLQIKASCVVTPNNIDKLDKIRDYWDGLINQFKFLPCLYDTGDETPKMCLELWRGNLNVHTNGNVSLCCPDVHGDLTVGNVLKTELRDIVNGPRMRRMLTDMIRGNPPTRCLTCHQFETSKTPFSDPKH